MSDPRKMFKSNAIGRSIAAALTAVLLAGLAFLGGGTAHALDQNAGANRFGACLAAQKTGDLLLLFDQSSSLQSTDPEDARLKAARYLLGTLGTYADRVGADLQLSAAGFSDTYKPGPSWTRLTEQSAGAAGDQIAGIARTDDGVDTDYQLALSGARQALAERGSGPGGAARCQAIAWFSDGKIDYTQRSESKPYADGVTLDGQAGVDATRQRAIDSICRPGGVADQVRSGSIIMLGVGLGAAQSPADFDVMSAISTGSGLNGMSCGQITEPIPGSFYSVSNIDDMLFAFDALNPDPGVSNTAPVCRIQVCPEARHNFTLDRSIKSVSILGSGGVPGVVPYLVAPSGETLELPRAAGPTDVTVAGTPVHYEWQSESAQTIALSNGGAPGWSGQWAIVYVDTTGEHPDAVSKVSIHITTDIYPALTDKDNLAWHSGSVLDGVTFGLVDGQGATVNPADLAGAAVMSVSLEPAGVQAIPILQAVPKEAIAAPVDVDLTDVEPGPATLKLSLVVTTAPALDPAGVQVAPGTELSPQDVEVPIQILPKLGLPTPGTRVDFGTGEMANGVTSSLEITGPGCAWVADSDEPEVVASPDGIGAVSVTSPSNSAQTCLKVADGETGTLQLTLRTEANGQGGLNGTLPVHVAALENPDDSQVVDVPFTASLVKPLNTTNFLLVLIAALLIGPGIPLALLYLSKWWVSKIPDTPLLAEWIQVEFDGDTLRRDGRPFAMADTDLVNPVPGLAGGARSLPVLGVNLVAKTGRSPFGIGRVVVESGSLVSTGSELPGTDDTGLRAVLPLAVHNKWVVLHDPHGPADAAEILLLVAGSTDIPARERIFEEIGQRAGELLNGLRLRAVQAGLASAHGDPGSSASPFGGGREFVAPAADPFGGGQAVASGPIGAPVVHSGPPSSVSDPFITPSTEPDPFGAPSGDGHGASWPAESAVPPLPAESAVPPLPAESAVPPLPAESAVQPLRAEAPAHPDDAVRPVPPPQTPAPPPSPPAGPPGAGPPAPPRFDPDPFDPFE